MVPYLKAARELNKLSSQETAAVLKKWAQPNSEFQEQAFLLANLLFKPAKGQTMPLPKVGFPAGQIGTKNYKTYKSPFTYSNQIPFLTVIYGYQPYGKYWRSLKEESVETFIDQCIAKGTFDRKVNVPGPKRLSEACDQLLRSEIWERSLTPDEVSFLRQQIEKFGVR